MGRITHSIPTFIFTVSVKSPLWFLIFVICVLFFSQLAWLELIDFIVLFKESAFSFNDFPYWFSVFNTNSYYVFSSAYFKFNMLLFLPVFLRWKHAGFRSFFLSNTYIQCYKCSPMYCFCCTPQLLMLYFNFHLVQKILKFLFKIIIKSVFGDFPVPFYLFPQSLRWLK